MHSKCYGDASALAYEIPQDSVKMEDRYEMGPQHNRLSFVSEGIYEPVTEGNTYCTPDVHIGSGADKHAASKCFSLWIHEILYLHINFILTIYTDSFWTPEIDSDNKVRAFSMWYIVSICAFY